MNDKAIITEAAKKYGIDPKILWGLYGTETSFGKNVSRSSAGAEGPFQFEPSTAKSLGVNPHDFKSAAFGAARYLAQYKNRGVGGMLSAYNAGPAGGYQSGYVSTTLKNAQSYGQAPGREQGLPQAPAPSLFSSTPEKTGPVFDQAGFRKAQTSASIAKLFTPEERKDNALFQTGILSTKEPSRSEFVKEGTGEPAPSSSAASPSLPSMGKLGGFLPSGAELQLNRIDQGQDVKTNPGGPIIAPGDGVVVAVKDNPGGFGERYPIVKFTSGPLAGKTVYIGHVHSDLPVGAHFKSGQPLAKTGYGTPKEGNARTPGWAEIGFWGPSGPGNMEAGKQIAPYLKKR